MITIENLTWLGTIAKTHGIKGQVILRLNEHDLENITETKPVFIEIDGLPVPFYIIAYEEKNPDTLLVSFESINNEESAKEITGCRVFVEKTTAPFIQPSDNIKQILLLKGYTVVDNETGEIGILTNVLDIEMNPLLCISTDKKELLVPAHTDFFTAIDQKNKTIYLNLPEGYSDLF